MTSDPRAKFYETVHKAAARFKELAQEADQLNLPIMARELDWMSKELLVKLGMQERAFRDRSLIDERG